jgi:hypothetical protein
MPTLDEQIGQALQEALASGELQRAAAWGRPLPADEGWDATPVELRLPFKILKDAGFAPPEIAWMHRAAALRREIAACPDAARADRLRAELAAVQQRLALRLEKLSRAGTL